MRMLLHWILSAVAVWIVSRLVPGFVVSGPLSALIVALVIGFVKLSKTNWPAPIKAGTFKIASDACDSSMKS